MAQEEMATDGRRARSMASRSRIIEAMVQLIEGGDPDPSAARVADKAGIALRSVYRLFEDKESIVREINQWLIRVYYPIITAPFISDDWRAQLFELIERRSAVNEAVVVFRISSISGRYISPYVREAYRHLIRMEKDILDNVLPDDLKRRSRIRTGLMIATSFDTWRYLRQDAGLSSEGTLAAIKDQVEGILERAQHDAPGDLVHSG